MKICRLNLIHKLYKNPNKIKIFPKPYFVEKGFFIIELETTDGLIGYGEISSYLFKKEESISFLKKYFLRELKNFDINKNYFKSNKNYNTIYLNNDLFYSIKSAIDQAILDLLGKIYNINSFKLFGTKKYVRAYSSGGVIFEDQEYDLLQDELYKAKNLNYFGWKFRPSIPIKYLNHKERIKKNPQVDLYKLEKFCIKSRKIAGDKFNLMIDLGCRLKFDRKSIKFLELLNDLNFYFIEEPFSRDFKNYNNLKNIRNIAIGENFSKAKMFSKFSNFKQIKYFQPDTNTFPFKDLLKFSKKVKKKIVLHNWTNSVNFYSNINFALASSKCNLVEVNTLPFPKNFTFLKENHYIKSGKLYLKNNKGTGVEMLNSKLFKTKIKNIRI